MSGDKGEDYISDDLPGGRPSKEKHLLLPPKSKLLRHLKIILSDYISDDLPGGRPSKEKHLLLPPKSKLLRHLKMLFF